MSQDTIVEVIETPIVVEVLVAPSEATVVVADDAPIVVEVEVPGFPGASAYQLAVSQGFPGTLQEWLESLVGADGQSAYQVAVDNGFGGTEAEWLASLQGEDGADGSFIAAYRGEWNDKDVLYAAGDLIRWSAPPGSTSGIYMALSDFTSTLGSMPEDFDTTLVVADGEDGASAYQVAVDNGFSGTQAEWLESLQGAPGLSAYQVAVANGFGGTEAEWLESLEGPAGSDADVTAENIELALGYVPADAEALAAVHQSPTPLTWGGGFKLHPFLGSTSGARQSLQVVQNRLYHQIGRPIGRVRVSNPAIEVNTGQAGSIARAGVCEWDAAGNAPGALLVDWGTADCSTPGTKTFSNGSAYADLDPSKAYSMAFVIGGAGTAATLYYQPFSPEAVPLFVLGTSMLIVGTYDSGGNSTQRTSGFTDPVTLVGSVTAEASANAPGQRNFFICDVVPTP